MMFFIFFASVCFSKPVIDRIASGRLVKPLLHQTTGYQFYARIGLPPHLESRLKSAYATSSKTGDVKTGSLYDHVRKQAHSHCDQLHETFQQTVVDDCTTVQFSPFSMSCELKIVVTSDCFPLRKRVHHELYDGQVAGILTENRVVLGVDHNSIAQDEHRKRLIEAARVL
jgi:hypothetical protein